MGRDLVQIAIELSPKRLLNSRNMYNTRNDIWNNPNSRTSKENLWSEYGYYIGREVWKDYLMLYKIKAKGKLRPEVSWAVEELNLDLL